METFTSATLADVDYSSASQGACILVAGQKVLDSFSTEELMGGLDLLRQNSKCEDMMLHPAVYKNEKNPDSLKVYDELGGLKPGEAALRQIAKSGGIDITSKMAEFFRI